MTLISETHPEISWLLLVSGLVFALGIALPLVFRPFLWGEKLGWRSLPREREFATYLARCLGVAGLSIIYAAVRAAPDPAGNPLVLELLAGATGLLALVHVWGAFERSQPLFETLEIPVFLALSTLFIYIRVSL